MATTTLTPTDTPKVVKKGDSKNPTTPTQTTFGCQHIKGLLQNARQQAVDGYTRLIGSLQREGNVTDRIHKSAGGPSSTAQATYLCLQCPTVSASRERHHKGHGFSVESTNGFIYCHECRDFVYDPTFEEIRSGGTSKKRKHTPIVHDADKKLVAAHSSTTPCAATGLRGLYNMGQTCFMSVILQSLIHNPLIRTYYLSEGHKAGATGDCDREACTSCALDEIFTDFFGYEKHEGYGAVHMLQGCWKGGGGLAGYSQQDAHEFLGFILNSLHEANVEESEEGGASTANKKDSKDCQCIIHQTFAGVYKSTVTCQSCSNKTTNTEAFMDLSVDVDSEFTEKKEKLGLINGTRTIKERKPLNLTECLKNYTSPELLPSESYHCRKCATNREANKKISLVRLPPVIPVHLKRFSHSKTNAQSSKVDTKVRFPFTLDMSPYVTTPKPKPADDDTIEVKGGGGGGGGSTNGVATEPTQAVYELSSVVVHKGKIDNGHYISYSKQAGEWFRFDDSMVVQVDEREVLGAEAYMLFYVVQEV